MSKDPAFLFYPGDYLRDTQCLSEKCQVAYDRIMCEHMRNICITQQQLKFFTKRLSPEEIDELLMVLTKTPQGFQIKWIAESILKRRAYSESRRKNRSKKSKKDMTNISKTYDQHMENENENEIVNKDEDIIEAEILENFPFDDFWRLYDKKTDRKKCEKKYNSLREKEKELIFEHLPLYIQSTPDKQFRKNPETYLNQRGWEHEIIMPNESSEAKGRVTAETIQSVLDGDI